MQRLRGGVFESLTVCRFPNTSLDFEFEWYRQFFRAATGIELTWKALSEIGDRVWNLIRAFWLPEYGNSWTREMDVPPARWFREPLTQGPLKGSKLDSAKYDTMLQKYYKKRGWNDRGIPKKITLKKLGLGDVAKQLNKYFKLSE